MKQVIGLIMVASSIVIGFYVGGWVCFVGGIIDVIEAIRSTDLVAMDVAIGVIKVMFAAFFGIISGMLLFIPGYVMMMSK